MLDIIEIAMEKGRDEGLVKGRDEGLLKGRDEGLLKGRDEGRDEGKIIGIQEMCMALLIEKFSPIPQNIAVKIKAIQDSDVLKSIFHCMLHCNDIKEFESLLNRV